MKAKIILASLVILCVIGSIFALHSLNSMRWINENYTNEEFAVNHRAVRNDDAQRRSMFCWNTDFENADAFAELLPVLLDFQINRLYVEIPKAAFTLSQTAVMAENLQKNGIEPVLLLGDPNWVNDGLDEYISSLNALESYNTSEGKDNPITTVALDVEPYTLPGWEEDPESVFASYISFMQAAYQEAHNRGLQVIQIIPAFFDRTVNRSQLETFLESCCDELSIMNYRKDINLSAIWNEVLLCRKFNIPVETIFETQPVNDNYGVTENNTFFYDGLDSLQTQVAKMESVYGTQLGIAYHYFRSMYRLDTGACITEIYPYIEGEPADENGQPTESCSILLTAPDGSVLTGHLYRPAPTAELRFLVAGAQPNVPYSVTIDSRKYKLASETITFDAESEEPIFLHGAILLSEK